MPDGGDGFRFVQFDFAGPLGVPEGRWVVRSVGADEAEYVLVVALHGARKARRRAKRLDGEPAVDGPGVTRMTVIDANRSDGDDAAVRRDAALRVVATAMAAWRSASLDPLLPETPPPPFAARVGIGSGEQVAHGKWRDARELPDGEPRRGRRRASPPEGRFAELLGGRAAMPVSATLAMRARLDLDSGRAREALIGVDAAIACALGELRGSITEERLDALAAHSSAAAAAAVEAREGEPGEQALEAATIALERLEAALRSLAS